jgi:hypothetical protein
MSRILKQIGLFLNFVLRFYDIQIVLQNPHRKDPVSYKNWGLTKDFHINSIYSGVPVYS